MVDDDSVGKGDGIDSFPDSNGPDIINLAWFKKLPAAQHDLAPIHLGQFDVYC